MHTHLRRSIRSSLFFTIAMSFLAACGPEDTGVEFNSTEADITGGTATTAYVGVGLVAWPDGTICSASMLSPKLVLTAAHCIRSSGLPTFYTGPGNRYDPTKPFPGFAALGLTAHEVDRTRAHPDYQPSGGGTDVTSLVADHANDIGLLRLKRDFTGRTFDIGPVPAVNPFNPPVCTVVGYGRDRDTGAYGFLRKKAATVNVVGLVASHVETAGGNGEFASGDSGGPLLCGGKIVGVTSLRAIPNSNPANDREFSQRAFPLRQWISQVADRWAVEP